MPSYENDASSITLELPFPIEMLMILNSFRTGRSLSCIGYEERKGKNSFYSVHKERN